MDDECIAIGRLTPQKPSIPVWTAIEFSSIGHCVFPIKLFVEEQSAVLEMVRLLCRPGATEASFLDSYELMTGANSGLY